MDDPEHLYPFRFQEQLSAQNYAVAFEATTETMAAALGSGAIMIYSAKLFIYGSFVAVFFTSLRLALSSAVESQEPLVSALR
jgi:hypothetical protein